MRNIVREIKTTIDLAKIVHQSVKQGKEIRIIKGYSIPAVNFGRWGFTPEACLFYGRRWRPIVDLFDGFDEKTQRALTFAPKDGEWVERVRFWQRELRPILEPKMYHEAMLVLIQWAIRCIQRRKETAA